MKVRIWCCTHDFQSEEEDIVEFPDDTSNADLEAYAEEFMWNSKEPEWGFERLDKK